MGKKKTETTQKTTIAGIGGQEQAARDVLSSLTSQNDAISQNLSDLTSGNLQLSPQDIALIQEIQRASQEQARVGMQDNAALAMNQVEGNLLDRNLGNASIEAVNKALVGRQLTQDLNRSALQGQAQAASQLQQAPFQRAQAKLNANQLLLNKILGAANSLGGLGLQERLAQTNTTQTQTQSGFDPSAIGGLAFRAGTAIATGGQSELVRAGLKAAATPGGGDNG